MINLSKELVEMQILLRKYKVPQRSIDKIINREESMKEQIYEYEQLLDIQDKREYRKRYLEDLNEYKKTLSEIKKEIEWILSTTDDDVIVARCSSILSLIEKLKEFKEGKLNE